MTDDQSSPAVVLMATQLSKRKEVRARWKEDAKDLLFAHESALSAIYRSIDRFSGRKFDRRPRDRDELAQRLRDGSF